MKIYMIKLGKLRYKELASLVNIYKERLAPEFSIQVIEAKENQKTLPKDVANILQSSQIIALDEFGKQMSSKDLATQITKLKMDPGVKSLAFCVGGSYGLPEEILSNARLKISLSKMTFTSDHAWLLLWEQLYRATTIIKGTPYHHG